MAEREETDRPDAAREEPVDVADGEPGVGQCAARALGVDLERRHVRREPRRMLPRTDDRGLPPDGHGSAAAKSATSRLKRSACSRGA